jgi:hypothetical protein
MFLDANTSTSLQTTLAADAQLAEKTIFTIRADTEQSKMSDIPSRNSETYNFQKRRAEFEIKLNLIKTESIEEIPPHKKNVQF